MYTVPLKDNSKEIDVVVLRSLLALAGLAAFFYRANNYAFINITIAVILVAAAFGVKLLTGVLQIKKLLLLSLAALLLFAATHAVMFSLILVAFGMASSFIYKKPFVSFTAENAILKSSKGTNCFDWEEFDNIVLRDNLLTLDFKNNRLLQLETDFTTTNIDEKLFNKFCQEQLKSADTSKAT